METATKGKHTQGPWTARMQERKGGTALGPIVEFVGGRIGWSSFATAEPNEGEGKPYRQSMANARLIAAAPDLLEALQAVEWGGHTGVAVCPGCGAIEFESVHSNGCPIKVALAKAVPA